MTETKIIAIDDDPTGSQTVHSCLLLMQWDVETLIEALEDDSPLFFVLSNTRSMDAQRAEAVTREICRNLDLALSALEARGRRINPIVVSRSDSTLRGHYPVETDAINEELGPFDAHFLVPAFFEGGRITRDGTHYLVVDGREVPVHETEFARDSVFGFSTAYLPDYVEEKTAGRIPADRVQRFLLDELRGDIGARLQALDGNVCCVVDAERQSDLDRFARQVREAAGNGKRFLFRSAASLLTSFAQLPRQPVAPKDMATYVRGGAAGVVLVGSHVRKSTEQLEYLLVNSDAEAVVVEVDQIETDPDGLRRQTLSRIREAHEAARGVVIYTSREERRFPDQASRLAFGERVSAFLMALVRALPSDLGFLISKGGITSNDVLGAGLALRRARVVGQILPGCSVVLCPKDHPRFPALPVVIFPGNVGDQTALERAYRFLTNARASALSARARRA
jgi:uncharacterized protein YgbK (DUF1537 family)